MCLFIAIQSVEAQDSSKVELKLGGLLFGDAYYLPSHHLPSSEGAIGGVLRRGYFTFNAKYGNWFSRARMELNQSGQFETYTFEIELKDLYIGYNTGAQNIIIGKTSTPTFDLIEKQWGLRYLMKTPMDLQGLSSRDIGLSGKGSIGNSESIGYRAMFGPVTGIGDASRDGWKWMGAVSWKPYNNWIFDLYSDYEILDKEDRYTLQLYTGYKTTKLRCGFQYSYQNREISENIELASAYIVGQLTDRIGLVFRTDRLFKPSPKGDGIDYLPFSPDAPATLFIPALELSLGKYFKVSPNVVFITYDKTNSGLKPDNDLHIRLSVYFNINE